MRRARREGARQGARRARGEREPGHRARDGRGRRHARCGRAGRRRRTCRLQRRARAGEPRDRGHDLRLVRGARREGAAARAGRRRRRGQPRHRAGAGDAAGGQCAVWPTCSRRCSAPATPRTSIATAQRQPPPSPNPGSPTAVALHSPRCCRRRSRCRWWATSSAVTGCCPAGCNCCSRRQCSSGSAHASTAPAGPRCGPAAATWTCSSRSARVRPLV